MEFLNEIKSELFGKLDKEIKSKEDKLAEAKQTIIRTTELMESLESDLKKLKKAQVDFKVKLV